MKDKRQLILTLIASVVVVTGFFLYGVFKYERDPLKKIGPFELGRVIKITDSIIYLDVDGIEKTANFKAETKVVKQVKGEDGLIKIIDVGKKDIKAGSIIVVYGSGEKIQIINE